MIRRWLAVMLLLSCTAPAWSAEVVERIAAVVNQHVILLSEINERLEPMMPQLAQLPNDEARMQRIVQLQRQALEQMISEQLIIDQADHLKIDVSERDLDLAVKDVMDKNNLTPEQLEAALKREGQSVASYRQQILKPQLLRLRVLQVQVRPRVSVSDDEVRALYQKNMRDLGVETQVRIRQIVVVVPPGAPPELEHEKEALLAGLRQKIVDGADFAELAKEHSEDSLSRAEGGDMGYVGAGQLPLAVDQVAFALSVGTLSDVIRSDVGYHVIKVEDRKEASALPLQDVKDSLRQQLFAEKMEKATEAWLSELRKKSYVDIKL